MNYKEMLKGLSHSWDTVVAYRTTWLIDPFLMKVCYHPIMDQLFIKTNHGWELFLPTEEDCSACDWLVSIQRPN